MWGLFTASAETERERKILVEAAQMLDLALHRVVNEARDTPGYMVSIDEVRLDILRRLVDQYLLPVMKQYALQGASDSEPMDYANNQLNELLNEQNDRFDIFRPYRP